MSKWSLQKIYILVIIFLFVALAMFVKNGLLNISFTRYQNFKKNYVVDTKWLDSKIQNITGDFFIWPLDYSNYESYLNDSDHYDIELYQITLKDFKSRLKEWARAWKSIRLILESKKYKEMGSDFKKLLDELSGSGIKIKSDDAMGTNYVHSKLFLMDTKFIIQTANITYSSFTKNREMFFVSFNKNILDNLKKIFEKDWNWKELVPADINPNLLVCNIDCRSKFQYFISLAKESIYIQTQSLSDKETIANIKKSVAKDIKIILSDSDENAFAKQEISTVKYMKNPYLHAKSMLIDNKYLIVWSMNLTQNSMDGNREFSIVLTDKTIIQKYLESFEKDRRIN